MQHPRKELSELAKYYHSKGWMLGTAGNLSALDDKDQIWITASGLDKSRLNDDDYILLNKQGDVLWKSDDKKRPSAETSIHLAIYRLFPEVRACLHVHTIYSNLFCRFGNGQTQQLPSLEMLKGLGRWEPNPKVSIAITDNHSEVPLIAREIEDRYKNHPPDVPGFLIRDHGLTAWGKDIKTANNHLELFSYLLEFAVEERTRKAHFKS